MWTLGTWGKLLITGEGGGGKFSPYSKKRGGGGRKSLSHAERGGGGHNKFWVVLTQKLQVLAIL